MCAGHKLHNSRSDCRIRRPGNARVIIALLWVFLSVASFLPSIGGAQTSEQATTAAELQQLTEEVIALNKAGKFSEAESLLQRLVVILRNLAKHYHDHGQRTEAEKFYIYALAVLEKIQGRENQRFADILEELAELYQASGQHDKAEGAYRLAIEILEKVLGPEHAEVIAILNNLAEIYQKQGRYGEAAPLLKRFLAWLEKLVGPEHPDVARGYNNLASLYAYQGHNDAATQHLQRAHVILEKVLGSEHPDVAQSLNNLAQIHSVQGQYAQAEHFLRKALAVTEKARGLNHPMVAGILSNLAQIYYQGGQYAQAAQLLERALEILEKAADPQVENLTGVVANNLAGIYSAQGRYTQAAQLHQRALAIKEKTLGSEHPAVAGSLDNLAQIYLSQGLYVRAEEFFRRALALREHVLGPQHPDVAITLNNLAELYRVQGRYTDAAALQRQSLAIREKVLGPKAHAVAQSLNNLAHILASRQEYSHARPLYERARHIHLAAARINSDLDDELLRGLLKSGHGALRRYAGVLASITRDPKLDSSPGPAMRDAFVVSEQVRAGAAQAALAKSSARAAVGDPATAVLARQVQDLRNQRQAMGKLLTEEYGKPTGQRNEERLKNLQEAVQRLDHELTEAVNRLNKAFPKYGELASPEPIDIAEVKKLLRADEALVSFFTFDDRLVVWLVRPDKEPVYKDIEIKKEELSRLVGRARASLQPEPGRLQPFDVAASHELFRLLIAPLQKNLAGVKHLIVVPDEVLLPLPFAALVTSAEGEPYLSLSKLYSQKLSPSPKDLTDYAKVSWLARDHALTVLPAATSLRALRQIPRPKSADTELLIAFGDPALRGRGARRGGAMLASRGTTAAIDEIRKLDRLPGTRDELMAVAKALGADPRKALYLGEQAAKPNVMSLNKAGRLAKAQVVSFATHGLIGGEVKGLKEPALVLTPPEKPNEQDDGLLSLEDILSLKLNNADWVILSACNTAAPGGSGEGLSGLVRAFFFAGTPSLLVSHWSVDDRATQALMTEVFSRYAKDKTMPRSEALRQGMLALMEKAKGQTAYFAHPFAWAPFFLVGEGGVAK